MYTKDGHKIIYKIRGGSHLYGLNTPLSDEDYIGIFLNNEEEILGLSNCEIIEENFISKKENGKNNSDAIDCKYYSLSKFCNLAINNNPTILEMFFAKGDNIIYCDEYGKKLIDNYSLFISQKSKHSYLGYAFSQKQKSFVKSQNLKTFAELLKYFNTKDVNYLCKTVLYDEIDNIINMPHIIANKRNLPNYVTIGDLNFNNQKLKDVKDKIQERINKASHRADGMLKNGLDYKFMSHTVRLLYEGIELLNTGKIEFPLKQKELLIKIKKGEVSNVEIINLIELLEEDCKRAGENTELQYSANTKEISKLIVDINKNYLLSNI